MSVFNSEGFGIAGRLFFEFGMWLLLFFSFRALRMASCEGPPSPVMPSSWGGRARLKTRMVDKFKLLYREAKAMTSSDFEAALLKSTRPDYNAPKAKHVESIIASAAYFDSYASADCDPYALLLHKIWSRLVETSPLTVTKAIYIYRRCLSSDQLLEARRMLGTKQSSKSLTVYFDADVVSDVSRDVADAADWRLFVGRYWAYVDAAWLACINGGDVSKLLAKCTRILFDKNKKLRHQPDCPLLQACADQILHDIYLLQLILLVSFLVDPQHSTALEPLLDIVTRPYDIMPHSFVLQEEHTRSEEADEG